MVRPNPWASMALGQRLGRTRALTGRVSAPLVVHERVPSFARMDSAPKAQAVAVGPIWAVMPCKGRLSFVKQTVPKLLAQPGTRLCVVDFSCPERVGDWIERTFSNEVAQKRVVVERVSGKDHFNKSQAHNHGARRAIREGATWLCFLDADTLVEPGFWGHLEREARPGRFLVAGKYPDGTDVQCMTGLLLVEGKRFTDLGGFDESFHGWGGEDIELRLRLYLLGGLDFGFIPRELTHPIPHDDNLRSQFYGERNIIVSNHGNLQRTRQLIAGDWMGRLVRDVSGAGPLWYRPPRSDPPRTVPPAVSAPSYRTPVALRRRSF